jgi:16S rRNA G966 N2-methylase RsmD
MSHMPPGTPEIPSEVTVKRSDPVYNAHAYLTKVPVTAIEPFIETFTAPGDVVLDMFGGSGMTGVAAGLLGRRAEIRDISVLGRHIGTNFVNLVDADEFRAAAEGVVADVQTQLGDVYATRCAECSEVAALSRTVWSFVFECQSCASGVNYYEAFAATPNWAKKKMTCPSCHAPFVSRGAKRLTEVPVIDTVACACSRTLRDQGHTPPLNSVSLDGLNVMSTSIGEDRQMFQASALKKHGLLTTSSFFSERNIAVLAALRARIDEVNDEDLRSKLLFAFTAVLARASKRYQWNPKRPLNAANQNYYVAPVYYEWNVYDLFERKVKAALHADEYLRTRTCEAGVSEFGAVRYLTGSADAIALEDESIDYVFTDPPFGSNIFYSDMNLFQEVWLGEFTDHVSEAVVDRSLTSAKRRTSETYERLMTDALREAWRVLKPDGWLSLVFSNSSGTMWALVQRAVSEAGFTLKEVTVLNKGQRSVKGLASGFENVVTVDLILSMKKSNIAVDSLADAVSAPNGALGSAVTEVLSSDSSPTPSHVYVGVIRKFLKAGWDVTDLDIGGIGLVLQDLGYEVNVSSGNLVLVGEAS